MDMVDKFLDTTPMKNAAATISLWSRVMMMEKCDRATKTRAQKKKDWGTKRAVPYKSCLPLILYFRYKLYRRLEVRLALNVT